MRVARATSDHHKRGWHATGTLGTIAACVAAGKLLGLEAEGLTNAMGIAATQASGLLENRDSACKALHAGKAGVNGLLAALLAARGIDSSLTALEGKQGFCGAFGKEAIPEALTQALGEEWAIMANGYKPFACAIGLHPVIEAMIALRSSVGVGISQVEQIQLRVSPYVSRYRSLHEPLNGHHAKFSVYHAAAVALLDGAAGVVQFADERASDPAVVELSGKIRVCVDESLSTDQAHASIVGCGAHHELTIDCAMGTERNPMSNEAIRAKFMGNTEPVIGLERARRVSEAVLTLETQDDVSDLISLCA